MCQEEEKQPIANLQGLYYPNLKVYIGNAWAGDQQHGLLSPESSLLLLKSVVY